MAMFNHYLPLLLLLGLTAVLRAQSVPRSNVYLFDMDQVTDSLFEFKNPRYLTDFNHNGYNNHPEFFDENTLYLSVQTPQQRQPELYVFNLRDTTKARVTDTGAGEYSPARMPDYYSFSAIRMEFDGRDTLLRLWQFPIDRLSNGRPIFKYIDNIGYYHWMNSQRVAIFQTEGSSNSLGIADTRTDEVKTIANQVGRCFRKLNNGNLLYVQKSRNGEWMFMERSLYRDQSREIINTLEGSEDFALLRDGTILMAQGSKLYKYDRINDEYWEEIADFRFYDISRITRLAVYQDRMIAIVGN